MFRQSSTRRKESLGSIDDMSSAPDVVETASSSGSSSSLKSFDMLNDDTTNNNNNDSLSAAAQPSCLLLLAAPAICAILGIALTPKFLVLAVVYLIAAARPLLTTFLQRFKSNNSNEDGGGGGEALNAMVRTALHSHKSLTMQFSMLATCLFLYEKSRVLCVDKGESTVHHAFQMAKHIILAEHALGLDVEPMIQTMFLNQHWLIAVANQYYGIMHFVVPVGVMTYLVITQKDARYKHRVSFFLMLVIALIIFVLLPTMPPRLLRRYQHEHSPPLDGDVELILEPYLDIVDTMAKGDTLYDKLHKETGNPYAAMPSMHTGWALWSCLCLMNVLPKSTIFGILHVSLTVFFIIITGNHFWLDAVGGAACVLLGRFLATLLTRERTLKRRDSKVEVVPIVDELESLV